MKQIVWIYGASAAGKETFIRAVASRKDLRNRFGWDEKRTAVCEESIEWVGKYVGDPIVNKRIQLESVIHNLLKLNNTVLIKGQDTDLVLNIPNSLFSSFPNYEHRVIYIRTNIAELMQRLPNKPWWNGKDTERDTLKWVNYQLGLLINLNSRIEISAISGSTTKDYELVRLPPI